MSDDEGGEPEEQNPYADLRVQLTMEEILGVAGTSVSDFITNYWEKGEVFTAQLDDEVLDKLSEGFYDGEPEKVVESCRREDNSRIIADDASEDGGTLQDMLGPGGKTMNLPFCFAPGAVALREAFVASELGEHANDVECGVYLSRLGGSEAEWHLDDNHNFTIQLTGQKDWHVIPRGDAHPVNSVAMAQPPRNRHEQQRPVPSAAVSTCYNLARGSGELSLYTACIYVVVNSHLPSEF